MITKIKSSKSSQWKLFIAIPAIAGLIFTFACSEKNGLMHDDETLSAAQNSSAFSEKTSIPSRCPIQGGYSISSHWGTRIHPIYKTEKHHSGCDFKAAKGTPVVATADGTVSELPESFTDGKGYGRFIVVDHGNGVRTRYAQLSGYKVEMGQVVSSGDIIGYVGMSGLATGAHLHYEVWNGEENLNPEDYFIQ